MKTEYQILRPSGIHETGVIDLPAIPSLQKIREIVDPILNSQRAGAYLEHVRIFSKDGEYVSMFVDDRSAQFGMKPNPDATREYHRNIIVHHKAPNIDGIMPGQSMIHGVAILFSRNLWN